MAQGVYTRQKRVTFVEKTLSEVGEGKVYPMLVTLSQIAEIFYRVKDAYFTAGTFTLYDNLVPMPFGFKIDASTTAPSNRSEEVPVDGYHQRGYTTESVLVSVFNTGFLGVEYDNGSGTMFRDIANRESALWLVGETGAVRPYWNGVTGVITNAFTFYTEVYASGSTNTNCFQGYSNDVGVSLPSNAGTIVSVVFSGEIAWVDVNGSGNPLDPLNELYIGVVMTITMGGIGPAEFACTDRAPIDAYAAGTGTVSNYVIRLQTGDISCPIYTDTFGWPTITYSDFMHEATEWFPYAKSSPPVPVWNTTTGAKL